MNDLILDTIESYNNYLAILPDGCINIAEKLREDQIANALKDIKDFTEGVIWLVDAGTQLSKNEVEVTLNISQIHDFLNEINVSLQLNDYNLTADLFEYEIAEFFKTATLLQSTLKQ